MTDFPSYAYGTVTVAATGTVVTGTGTIWSGVNARPGDLLKIGANIVDIVDVVDETHLKIDAWPYAAVTDVDYKIVKWSPLRFVGAQARADVSDLLATLNAKGLLWYLDPAYTEPDDARPPLTADEGQAILKIDTGALWVMQGGAWVEAGTFKGISFKGAYDSGTTYNVNDVLTSDGNAYIVITPTTGNAPPNATYYSLLASKGDKGDTGTIGIGTVTTGAAGSSATVTNSGTTTASVLDFTIPRGDQGVQGIQGIQGIQGQGIQPDASGTAADKATHDLEAAGYVFLQTDVSPFQLWVKASATSGDWAGPTYVTGNVPLGDLGFVTDSVEQSFDLGVLA